MVFAATSAGALERRAVAFDEDSARSNESAWVTGGSTVLRYYNTCTGWIWAWSGFEDGDRIGVVSAAGDADGDYLFSTALLVRTGAPSGYGFTGTISVFSVDANGCPTGAADETQPFLPATGFNVIDWANAGVPPFVLIATIGGGTFPNPVSFSSDHPAAGPTGPQALGTCYPASRSIRSFYFGTSAESFCPGLRFDDGIGAAQLIWDSVLTDSPTPVDDASWGAIKALYR